MLKFPTLQEHVGRDLDRTRPTCLLDRPFPENLHLDSQNFLLQIFNLDFDGVITRYSATKPSLRA